MKQIGSLKINEMRRMAQFVLFLTSYSPLFVLIGLRQVYENSEFLYWGGWSGETIWVWLSHFWLTMATLIFSVVGIIGAKILFASINKDCNNGNNVIIEKISNRNSESIGYIATYIVPFLFQNFNTWYEIFALIFLMIIIYRIYINSNLLLINPILGFVYSIYEIEYKQQNGKIRCGLIITNDNNIEEDSIVKIYEIGFKLFFAKKRK